MAKKRNDLLEKRKELNKSNKLSTGLTGRINQVVNRSGLNRKRRIKNPLAKCFPHIEAHAASEGMDLQKILYKQEDDDIDRALRSIAKFKQ